MLAPQGRRLCRAGHGEAPGSSGPVTGASFFTVTPTPNTPPSLAAERQHTWASRRGRLGGRAVGPVWGAWAGGDPVHAVEQSNARSVPRRVTRHTVRPHAHASGPPQPAGSQAPERGATGPGGGPRGPQLMCAAAAGTNLGPRAPRRAQGRLGSGSGAQNAGSRLPRGGGGSRGGGPPTPMSAPGAGPLPTGTDTMESPAFPPRQGPAALHPREGCRSAASGWTGGSRGPRWPGLGRVSWELTGHLWAGRTSHPARTDPSASKPKHPRTAAERQVMLSACG